MKTQVIKIRNLPEEVDKTAYAVRVKPWGVLMVVLVAGIVMLILKSYMIGIALPLIILTLFAILGMPDRILVQFMDDYLVMYNRSDRTECTIVYWEEVVSWHYESHHICDRLVLSLVDGTTESVDMYSKRSIAKQMEKFAKGKEKKNG